MGFIRDGGATARTSSRAAKWGILLLLAAAQSAAAQPEFRAVWADAFQAGLKSTAQIDTLVTRAKTGNYNAIIAQVLAYHDNVGGGHGAYWNSAIVPKAGDAGGFDPLGYLCQQAHAQGIEVHAWLVPFRVSTSWPPSGNTVIPASGRWLMVPQASMGTLATVAGWYTLDPGSPEVQDYLVSIVRELVTNYPIDGINWDYIRYTQPDAGYPRDISYTNSGLERYKRINNTSVTPPPTGNAAWDNFRRRTIDELIRRARAEIPSIRSNPRQPLRHTADLFATGNAPSTCGGFTSSAAYARFQNWALWMERGWLDAAIPMNYKRDHCSSQATWYRNWVNRTLSCWRYSRHVYMGQATYLNSFENSVTQLQYSQTQGANGMVTYSYAGTRSANADCDGSDNWANDSTWYTYVRNNLFTSAVPTPVMPWRNPATASEGTVWGRVWNHATSQPVEDATVSVTGSGQPGVLTDANGYYTVTLVPASASGTSYSMNVSKSGLPSASRSGVIVLAGDVVRYDFSLGAPPAQMEVSPTSIVRLVRPGNAAPNSTFEVINQGGGTLAPLNYTITHNGSWMSVTPPNGSSNGESSAVTIMYNASGLGLGIHNAAVTVSDTAAGGSPQTVDVTLAVVPPGDFDGDLDVDQDDFAFFQLCLSGPFNPPPQGCDAADLDGDGDVDDADFTLFFNCVSGANLPGDLDCLN